MNLIVYASQKWNELAALVRSAWPFPGKNARLRYNGLSGVIVDGIAGDPPRHPWQMRCVFEYLDPAVAKYQGEGEWRAYVKPGFVNCRDTYLAMPQDWPDKPARGGPTRDVPLTEETPPFLVLTGSFRDPVASQGMSVSDDGEIIYGAGEGYPKFFEQLGVRPAAVAGSDPTPPSDPERTREIRAVDVVLDQPRIGSALDVETLDPLTDGFSNVISTTYTDAVYIARGGRPRLYTTAKFTPIEQQLIDSPFLGLPMNSGDPQVDERKIATIYLVSPPDAGSEAVPDQTWQAYPANEVFWNLLHATRFVAPAKTPEPLKLNTGLGLGILDTLANAYLAQINSGFDEISQYLNQADMRGKFWSI